MNITKNIKACDVNNKLKGFRKAMVKNIVWAGLSSV